MPTVRAAAARALARGGPPPEAVGPLSRLLSDPDADVREAARSALRGE